MTARTSAEIAADRIAWLEHCAARCEQQHPDADCHKRYRRNAAAARAELERTDR